jgi:hypothetical protein
MNQTHHRYVRPSPADCRLYKVLMLHLRRLLAAWEIGVEAHENCKGCYLCDDLGGLQYFLDISADLISSTAPPGSDPDEDEVMAEVRAQLEAADDGDQDDDEEEEDGQLVEEAAKLGVKVLRPDSAVGAVQLPPAKGKPYWLA